MKITIEGYEGSKTVVYEDVLEFVLYGRRRGEPMNVQEFETWSGTWDFMVGKGHCVLHRIQERADHEHA